MSSSVELDDFSSFDEQISSIIYANPRLGNRLEIEARMGYFIKNSFVNDVKFAHIKRISESLDRVVRDEGGITKTSVSIYDIKYIKGVRQRKTNNSINDKWEQKLQLPGTIDIPEYLTRIAFNSETNIKPPTDPNTIEGDRLYRTTTRTVYRFDSLPIEVSISKVRATGNQITKKKEQERQRLRSQGKNTKDVIDAEDTYEVEVEMQKPCTVDKVPGFLNGLTYIFKMLYGTENLYTVSTRENLNYLVNCNCIMSDSEIKGKDGKPLLPARNYIDRRIFTEARNIKIEDLNMGAMIGAKWQLADGTIIAGKMTCTDKTHGKRSSLIICEYGVWIVFPPYDYNLIVPSNKLPRGLKTNLYIFDCESIPNENRRFDNMAPSSKYWLEILDILFSDGKNVQRNDLITRMKVAKVIHIDLKAKGYFPPSLTVTDKDMTRSWSNVDEFFDVVSGMIARRDRLPYETDGLMFIPVNHKYMIYNWDMNPKLRVLSNAPDIVKWKPPEDTTIDFKLYRTQEGLRLLNEGLKRDKDDNSVMEVFKGSTSREFDYQTMLMQSHPLTDSISDQVIVEYAWKFQDEPLDQRIRIGIQDELVTLPKGNYLYPVRLRLDKSGPNRVDVADANWNAIMYPIKTEDISGLSMGLMTRYHNDIKMELYMSTQGNKVLLDLGSGNGGDVGKWKKSGYTTIIAVEPDEEINLTLEEDTRKSKISEITRRLESSGYNKSQYRVLNNKAQDSDVISKVVNEVTNGRGVDTISLMLSLSFFWENVDYIKSLAKTIELCLKPGGTLIWLTLDGTRVRQIFQPAFGGLRYKQLEFGPVSITPEIVIDDSDPHNSEVMTGKLTTVFPGIVGKQIEYMVVITDLLQLLPDLEEIDRKFASSNQFMPEESRKLSKLYSYGIWKRKISHQSKMIRQPSETPPTQIRVFPPTQIRVFPPAPSIQTPLPSVNSPQVLPSKYMSGIGALKDKKLDDLYTENKIILLTAQGDGSCLIHSFLICLSEEYRKSNRDEQQVLASKIRRDMADWLISRDTDTTSSIRWETTARGAYLDVYLFQIQALCSRENLQAFTNYVLNPMSMRPNLDEGLDLAHGIDYSPSSLFSLINSTAMLGTEAINAFTEMFGIDVYVVKNRGTYIEGVTQSSFNRRKNPSICVVASEGHFDAVGVQDRETGLATVVFRAGNANNQHPFLTALRNLFGLDPYNDEAPSNRDIGVYNLEDVYLQTFLVLSREHDGSIPDILYRELEACRIGRDDGFKFPQPVNDRIWQLGEFLSGAGVRNSPVEYYTNETVKSVRDTLSDPLLDQNQRQSSAILIIQKNCYYMAQMSSDKEIRDVFDLNTKADIIVNTLKGIMPVEYQQSPLGVETVKVAISSILISTNNNPKGKNLYSYEVLRKWLVETQSGTIQQSIDIINALYEDMKNRVVSLVQ